MTKGVSVIICCYNSANRLPTTLSYLASQKTNVPWELIIVDNNSVDETNKIAARELKKYPALADRSKIVTKKEPGLTNARSKGITEAFYEYILFCDDDNWLTDKYIQIGYDFLSGNPQCGVLGGWSTAVSSAEFPSWFEQQQYCFAVGRPHAQTCDTTDDGQVWGAGMVTRKSLLEIVFNSSYPFLCLGRKGKSITSGDDDELCMRIVLMGFRLYNHEELHFVHELPPDRLTESYLKRLYAGFEHSAAVSMQYQILYKIKKMDLLKKLLMFAAYSVKFLSTLFVKNKIRRQYSQAVLYYLTEIPYFSNEATRGILRFDKYARKLVIKSEIINQR
jgi:glycosyltransferase involved in cell wall biosynthesis